MPTRSFEFFCVPEECFAILDEVFLEVPAVLFIEGPKGGLPLKRTTLGEVISIRPTVLWASVGEGVPTSFLGVVRILPPRYQQTLLCMASIGIKVEGERERFTTNLKLYETIRRVLKRRLKAGLWGVNEKYGGEHYYRNLYISEGAIEQFGTGQELAPEGGDGFVRFEYRDTDD